MAVPKRRTSKMKQRSRLAHSAAKPKATVPCPECNNMILPHRVCPFCGYFQGRQVENKES